MGTIFSNIVQFFNRNILVYFGILGIFSLVLLLGVNRLVLDKNIYGIFPKGDQFQKFNNVLKENNLNKQIMFSINIEGKKHEEVYAELDSISKKLISETIGLVTGIQVFREDQEEMILSHYYDFFPVFLTIQDYQDIDLKLHEDSIRKSIKDVSEHLGSSNSLFLRQFLSKDPLGLMWPKIQSMNPKMDSKKIKIEDGILYSKDHSKAIFTGVLDFELNNDKKNKLLNEKLASFKSKNTSFDYFGTFLISYENAKQVKQDTFITMVISLGLILLLLVIYYKSIFTPIIFILPAAFSGFCGLGILGFIDPNISAISVATSAVLLGIVLDYSFHFMTHFAHTGDLNKTVKELTFPMLVGSFTTIAAFLALLFTDSVVLQDFGLLALLSLSSAAIFTLLFLPTIIKITGFKPKQRKSTFKLSKTIIRIGVFSTLIITVLFLIKMPVTKFDSDLNNLSFHTEELVEKEEFYTGINPKEEKKIHFFVEGKTKAEAIERNFNLFQNVVQYHKKNELEEILSVAPYLIPSNILDSKQAKWDEFWEGKIDSVFQDISRNGAQYDFSERAFNPFNKWIKENDVTEHDLDERLLTDLGLSKLIHERNGKWSIVTSVTVHRSKVVDFKKSMSKLEEVYIFDVSEMASTLMLAVQDDFNYLLILSSLIVLISLLFIYGRIELALFSFFPLVISWIWILYIASWLDIQFNFVNIIIATFIFGLGDDFSIFMTDGLIQKYRTKSSALSSYRLAIVLSAITTIIGTGVLYLAKHPAIHSIAIISVIGISCILLVTVLVQPVIFNFFIANRIKSKRSPITLLGLVFSTFLFTYFIIGCVILNLFLFILILVPASKQKKKKLLNRIISNMARSVIYLSFHNKKRFVDFEKLDFSKPAIIVTNHSSFLDILLVLMINPKSIILVKKWVYYSPFFGFVIRYAGYLYTEEGAEQNLEVVSERIKEGYSIIIFPEGTRSLDGTIGRFRKGAFYLAQELKLDIQPILVTGVNYINPKNDFIIKSGKIMMVAMDRITHNSEMFAQRFGLLTKDINKLMCEAQKETYHKYYNTDELKSRVMYNYLYKNPISEWYVRIKWMFEKGNFEKYDSLIADRKRIYDVGCGLGYLGYYLHYRDGSRKIIGIDYDEDKLVTAQNGYDKTDNLEFRHGDVRSLMINDADVVFFNDVLHYMNRPEQLNVLRDTVNSLSDDGLIFIRDGITDLNERHNMTKRTEKYSTKIINFNKVTNDLSFFSSKDIFNFAEEQGISCEMIEQSTKTSNVLFILRK